MAALDSDGDADRASRRGAGLGAGRRLTPRASRVGSWRRARGGREAPAAASRGRATTRTAARSTRRASAPTTDADGRRRSAQHARAINHDKSRSRVALAVASARMPTRPSERSPRRASVSCYFPFWRASWMSCSSRSMSSSVSFVTDGCRIAATASAAEPAKNVCNRCLSAERLAASRDCAGR